MISSLTAANSQLREEAVKGKERCDEEKAQCEATVVFMADVMLQNNQLMLESQNLLEAQGNTIKEANEEIRKQMNSSSICQAAADSSAPQAKTIALLRSSLAGALDFQELSTSGLDNLNLAQFMTELMESYNEQTKMIENLKAVLQDLQGGEVSAMTEEMTNLASAIRSTTVNLDIVEQQAQVIQKQGKSIAQLVPLLRHTNKDIVWHEKTEETGVQSVASCSCLPRSLQSSLPRPTRIEYECQDSSARIFNLPCVGGVCKSKDLPSCTSSGGVVKSSNYPANYPDNHQRTQTITGGNGMVLVLSFTDFNLEVTHDHLTIRDGDGTVLMARRDGSGLPPNIISRTNVVYLDFHSDSSVTSSGWSVSWFAVTPGV